MTDVHSFLQLLVLHVLTSRVCIYKDIESHWFVHDRVTMTTYYDYPNIVVGNNAYCDNFVFITNIMFLCVDTSQRRSQRKVVDVDRQLQKLREQLQAEKDNNVDLRGQLTFLEQQLQSSKHQPSPTEDRCIGQGETTNSNEQLVKDLEFWKTESNRGMKLIS